jgi:hypothetical protein
VKWYSVITIFVVNTTFYDLQFAKHLTDVQTDEHIVPVDSEVENCNLLILPTTDGALVLYIGTFTSPGHHKHPHIMC